MVLMAGSPVGICEMEEEPSNSLIEKEFEAADEDGFSLIDGSAVDDLFISVSGMDDNLSLLDGATMLETPEAEIPRKKEKYNLRKSLAWDSAFFTSDGVLDAEELSSIIEGSSGRRKKMRHLPGIQEDTSKSNDSLSTLESDNSTLESLEADLFCDIRGSAQKSAESSNLRVPRCNGRQQETEAGNQPRTKKVHQGNMAKPYSALKLSTELKGDEKPMKLGPVREQMKKPSGSRMSPSSSLLKTPAVSPRGSSIMVVSSKVPTKRTATTTGRVKLENNNDPSAAERRTTLSRGPGTGENCTIIPKTSSYAKSSPGSSATSSSRIGVSSTRSSFDSTNSSARSRPSPHSGSRGKSARTVSVPPPSSKSKILSRVPLKGKSRPGSPLSSGCLSKHQVSPSVSPTSSRSDWSSSSSTATLRQERMVSKGCSNTRRTFSLDNCASQDLDTYLNLQTSSEHDENEVAEVPNGSTKKLLASNGYRSNPVSAKPSGLRMPSPKIGFFDGIKTGERTPNVASHLHSLAGLPSSRLRRSTIGSPGLRGVSNKGSTRHPVARVTPVTAGDSDHDTPRTNSARMNPTAGGRLGRKPVTPERASNEKTSKDISEASSVKISEEVITAAVKFPQSGSSSKKEIGLVSSGVKADPETNVDSDVHYPHELHESSYGGANSTSKDASEATSVKISKVEVTAAVKLPESGSSSKKRIGLVCSGIEADPETNVDSSVLYPHEAHVSSYGDTDGTEPHPVNMSPGVGSAVKADDVSTVSVVDLNVLYTHELCESSYGDADSTEPHPVNKSPEVSSAVEADDGSTVSVVGSNVLNPHELHESSYGDTYSTEPHPVNMSPEASSAVKANDGSAVAVAVIKDQQVETVHDNRDFCENLEPQSGDSFASHSVPPALSNALELSGYNPKEEAAGPPKQSDLSNLSPRTPFADKISLSDANSFEILVKGFNSLSLDNSSAKDVKTEMETA